MYVLGLESPVGSREQNLSRLSDGDPAYYWIRPLTHPVPLLIDRTKHGESVHMHAQQAHDRCIDYQQMYVFHEIELGVANKHTL